jgi:hypothetical protein
MVLHITQIKMELFITKNKPIAFKWHTTIHFKNKYKKILKLLVNYKIKVSFVLSKN